MTLIAGSYERFIWGFKVKQTFTLTPLFSYGAHLSPIKSVATSSTLAASSSSDDSIKLYDLSTSTELGSLPLHSSATSLSFHSSSSSSSNLPLNLISGNDDGSLSLFDLFPSFLLLKSFPLHRKSLNSLSLHPSGRLALSVARDSCLAMANLVRGRRSFCCRLEKEASLVMYFGTGGESFFLVADDKVSVHDSEDARLVNEFAGPKKILCAAPAESGLILTGGEDRGITAWDTLSGKVAYTITDAHKSRVKGIVLLTKDHNSAASEDPFLVASASSDGVIRVWDVRATSKEKPEPLSEVNTKSRLTCLAGSSIKSLSRLQKKDVPQQDAGATEDS